VGEEGRCAVSDSADVALIAAGWRARSDGAREVLLSFGDTLCRQDRVAVQGDLRRPTPVTGAKWYLELGLWSSSRSRAGYHGRPLGAPAPQKNFCEYSFGRMVHR
jgi:hypothetical protein